MTDRIAIVTNVMDYAGPPAVAALAADGFRTICHSTHFIDSSTRATYESGQPNRIAAKAQSQEELVSETLAKFGRIDVVVSNDAADIRLGLFEDRTAEDYRDLLEAFAVAPFRLAGAVVPTMKQQGSGRIILITSGAPLQPLPNMVLYSATRAATNMLAKGLARELGPAGVSVNAIAPFYLLSSYFPGGMESPEFADRINEVIPMKRFGQPEEIGALISLLASGNADFISGQVIAFSGGGA